MTDGMIPNSELLEARKKYAKRIKLIMPQAKKDIRNFCIQICSSIGVEFDKELENEYDVMAKQNRKDENTIKTEKMIFRRGACQTPAMQTVAENFIESIPMLLEPNGEQDQKFSNPGSGFITTSIIVPKTLMNGCNDKKSFGKATQEHLTTEILFALQNKSVNNSGFTADKFLEELRRFKEYAIKKPQYLQGRTYVDVVAGTRMLTKSAIEAAKQMWPEQKEIFNSFDAELQGTGFYKLKYEGKDESNHKAIDQFQLILDGALNSNLNIESFYNRHGDELSNVYTSNTGHLEGIVKYIVNNKISKEEGKSLIMISLQQAKQNAKSSLSYSNEDEFKLYETQNAGIVNKIMSICHEKDELSELFDDDVMKFLEQAVVDKSSSLFSMLFNQLGAFKQSKKTAAESTSQEKVVPLQQKQQNRVSKLADFYQNIGVMGQSSLQSTSQEKKVSSQQKQTTTGKTNVSNSVLPQQTNQELKDRFYTLLIQLVL